MSKLSIANDSWRFLQRSPTHPGVYVQENILDAFDLTQQGLADAIGVSRLTISEIVRGKRNITESMALRLAHLTKTMPEVWLNLQRNYSLWKVSHEEKAELTLIKPLNKRR